MNTLNKTISIFVAILFVITAVMATLLFNFDRRAFTVETYQRAFEQQDFYNKLPTLLARSVASAEMDNSQMPIVMQNMSAEAWEGFFRILLPPEVLQVMGNDILNSTFAYLNLESNSIQVNLLPVKASMVSDTGTQAVFALFSSLPACTLDQIAQITINLMFGGQIEFCNPPADVLPLLTPVVTGQMQIAASLIPDSLTLVSAPPENDPREKIQTARFFMRLSLILPISFLLTLTVFAVRSVNDWLTWWGFPFAATGFITLVIGILGAPVLSFIVEQFLAIQAADYLPNFLLEFTGDLAAAMVRALLTPVLWQGLALTVLGSGMGVVGYFVKK